MRTAGIERDRGGIAGHTYTFHILAQRRISSILPFWGRLTYFDQELSAAFADIPAFTTAEVRPCLWLCALGGLREAPPLGEFAQLSRGN